MRNVSRMVVAAALLGAIPASAQMRRAPVPSARPMRSAHRTIADAPVRQVPPPARVVYVHPSPVSARAESPAPNASHGVPNAIPARAPSNLGQSGFGGTSIPLDQLLNPTPGLGFDYSHLAAVNSGLAVNAFIDPITEHELAIAQRLPQVQPVGFFSTYFAPISGQIAAPQPVVIVVQQPVTQPAPTAAAPAPPAPRAAPAPPPLPVGRLILVRRDGKSIQVIAFTQQDGQIVYITADGMRRSMAMDQLDVKATEQRNAERGTILHLTQ